MSITRTIALFLLMISNTACGMSIFADPKTNPVIEDRVGAWGDEQLGTLATTAERRTVLVKLTGTGKGLFCAEPPPDAAENIASQVSLALAAAAKGVEGKFEFDKTLATTIEKLGARSQGLQLYRDGMYQLCQSYLNGIVTPKKYVAKMDELLEKVVTLIEQQLTLTGGIIQAPSPRDAPR